jgi:hypothetical protein
MMGKYVLAYRGGGMAATEAEQQAAMAAWMSWFGELGSAVIDGGNPFGPSTSVAPSGAGGQAGSGLTGYSVLAADNLSAAADLAKGCPILTSGGTVDVYEAVDM